MIIELNGFIRGVTEIASVPSGSDVLEVWTNEVIFENAAARAVYFRNAHSEHCMSVSVDQGINGKKFRFAFNDEYVDSDFPAVSVLPSDEELEEMLTALVEAYV